MQQPSPLKSCLKLENRFPSCISMELEAKPTPTGNRPWLSKILPSNADSTSTREIQIDLFLSIRFGEETLKLPGGSIRFGLRHGEFKLTLENGEVPLKAIELGAPFQVWLLTKIQNEQGSEVQGGATFGASSSLKGTTKGTKKAASEVSYQAYQVNSTGSATEPSWIFEVKTAEPVLKGLLKETKLCTAEVNAKPCRIEASFEISKRSIRLTGAEGLWPSDIDRNKLAILQRKLALLLLERQLTHCLSRLELVYD